MPTIQPFHHRRKKTKLTLEFDFELAEMIKAYAAHYKQVHGADVSAAELSIEILRQAGSSLDDCVNFERWPK